MYYRHILYKFMFVFLSFCVGFKRMCVCVCVCIRNKSLIRFSFCFEFNVAYVHNYLFAKIH